jgi:hypothetical protein
MNTITYLEGNRARAVPHKGIHHLCRIYNGRDVDTHDTEKENDLCNDKPPVTPKHVKGLTEFNFFFEGSVSGNL